MRQTESVDREKLAHFAGMRDVNLPSGALEPLAAYLNMLCRWNGVMNLTGAHSWQEIFLMLVLDSFHLANFLDGQNMPDAPLTWDLGAGAGLPGIPLRMVWTRGSYHMVEARQKRALFLSNVLAQLDLPDTHVFRGTVQDFFSRQARPADCIVSRAFLPWPELLGLVLPHLQTGGMLVVMASAPAPKSLPNPWQMRDTYPYPAPEKKRWLWALTPERGL